MMVMTLLVGGTFEAILIGTRFRSPSEPVKGSRSAA